MNRQHKTAGITLITLLMVITLLASCDSSSTTTTSDDARVASFSFYSDTANPGLTTATYKIIHSSDTGLIYNKDSLDFGTCLDSVVPYITFNSTPGSAVLKLTDTTLNYTGSDTLNFNKQPIYLYVQASDMAHERWYQIAITVHQVDPDLYVWKQLVGRIYPAQSDEQQAFAAKNGCYLYVNNGFGTTLYFSREGVVWEKKSEPVGLPVPCHVRQMIQVGEQVFYADADAIYYSTDYVHWTSIDCSKHTYSPVTMLVAFDNQAWCIVQHRTTKENYLAYIENNQLQVVNHIDGLENGILPTTFPISDFSSLPIHASSERSRSMIIGGRDTYGQAVNSRWNLEKDGDNDYRIRNFSIEQPSFHSLSGISVIEYNDHLMMFGGIDNDETWHSDLLYSMDEGMNWFVPDSSENMLPETYCSRQKQTVVVDSENNILIIGGQNDTTCLSDVHRGFLMSINWDD